MEQRLTGCLGTRAPLHTDLPGPGHFQRQRPHRPNTNDLTERQSHSGAITPFRKAMAQHAENQNTIGVASQRWLTDAEQQSAFVMTKLSQQPNWMGFNPLPQNLRRFFRGLPQRTVPSDARLRSPPPIPKRGPQLIRPQPIPNAPPPR